MEKKRHTTVRSINQGYPVIVQEDISGGYWITCPSFEGCYSQGKTVEKALENIKEAIELCREDLPKTRARQATTNVSLHFIRV